jgi:hypothetical protein
MPSPGTSDREAAAWEAAAGPFLSGAPPSLTFAPRPADPSAAAGKAAAATPSIADLRARAAETPLPPPQRKVLEGVLLLWHDHWEAAHEVAQSHEGQSDHDLLHAIGHRREGDYPNAGYWFRSAGRHPAHAALSRSATALLPSDHPLRSILLPGGQWSPTAFNAQVKRAVSVPSPQEETLIRLQALEMRLFAGWLLSG